MRLLLPVLSIFLVSNGSAASSSRQAAVNKAIEQTKSRQMSSSINTNNRVPQRSNVRLSAAEPATTSSPGKTENLDVERLNKLIRALDKTWIMPKTGSKEPVGSNFQYKKTCASIFKARHGACQQLGFGIMCFNYCHERGEKLAFKCQDASDAAYCRQSGTFDTFLAKYRKDGYKAKAYIHQMISRCYATAICNSQTGLLNSTIANEEIENVEKTTPTNRLKLLTKPPGGLKMFKLKTKTTTAEPGEEEETVTETTVAAKKKGNKSARTKSITTTVAPSTTKSNIWDKFTVGSKGKVTPKYIPFWQKLMTSTTTGSPTEEEEEEEEEEKEEIDLATPGPEKNDEDEGAEEVEEEDIVVTKTPVLKTNQDKKKKPTTTSTTTTTTPEPETTPEETSTTEETVEEEEESTTTPSRHTFKPLPSSTPPAGPETFQKPGIDGSGPGFWNRFQPNRWFQSIHYVTNTGR